MTDKLPRNLAEAELAPGVFLFPGRWEGQMREMRVAEENMLLTRRKKKGAFAIESILQACILSEGIDVREMLIGDRVFAMLQLRRITYGDEYIFKTTCPRCETSFEWEENLGDLPVKYLADPAYADPDHTFRFVFPKSGKTIKWRLLRGKDEERLVVARRENPEMLVAYSMLLRCVEIEGEKKVTSRFFNELPASDAAAFRGEVEGKECGVETTITITCPECRMDFDVDLPLGVDFFLPRKRTA
ncbi:MAG TPA: hypothetical protein GX518_02495 [Firmicutes bacterium]|nr:hypothetical protein [Bacillota bacterium]